MKRQNYLALALTLSTLTSAALADTHSAVNVSDPWTRPTPPGTPMGVGYMVISNQTGEDIRLVGAQTPKAGHVSIHETVKDGDIMRMKTVDAGLAITAGGTIKLEPMSYHLMLERLNSPIRKGETVPITLEFEGAEPIDVKLRVQSMDEIKPMHHSSMKH